MNKSFKCGTGKVVYKLTKTKTEDGKLLISEVPEFRGKPEAQAKLLMRAHTPSGAVSLIDKLASTDLYWIQMRNYITNRIKEAAERKSV